MHQGQLIWLFNSTRMAASLERIEQRWVEPGAELLPPNTLGSARVAVDRVDDALQPVIEVSRRGRFGHVRTERLELRPRSFCDARGWSPWVIVVRALEVHPRTHCVLRVLVDLYSTIPAIEAGA